jgi:hypothetical protein
MLRRFLSNAPNADSWSSWAAAEIKEREANTESKNTGKIDQQAVDHLQDNLHCCNGAKGAERIQTRLG